MDSDWLDAHRRGVESAAATIAGQVRRTPVLDVDVAGPVLLKPECLQRTGSFKVRGAFNAVLRLVAATPDVAGVVAVSSGNHAQAVALAARTAGLPAVVVMPEGSNPVKVGATRALGAVVTSEGVSGENREAVVRELAATRGLALVHPFDDWDVVHGQGTAVLELLADRSDVGLVAVPIGGGGLISGSAVVAASATPRVRVIGVEPVLADDAARSLRAGRRLRLDAVPATIADGVRSLALGDIAAEVVLERGMVEDVVTVTEAEIEAAVTVALRDLHLVVEPSGALPLAAQLAGRLPPPPPGRSTALLLSGGNVDPALLARLLGPG
jgi:threo-3-hydroxy-L-aspartate ammonia-lyase